MSFENRLLIGTSGWGYKDWKDDFYPASLNGNDYLSYYSQFFNSVEINSSFYHTPKTKTIINWNEMVPDNFRFCFKLSKYITHYEKLTNVEGSLDIFFQPFNMAGRKPELILIQLPASLPYNPSILIPFLDILSSKYKSYCFALEARNESWFSSEVRTILRRYNISWVISYSNKQFPFLEAITSEKVYYRFHGPGALYNSSYPLSSLKKYSKKIISYLKDGLEVWAFFNNTMHGYGWRNALTLHDLING